MSSEPTTSADEARAVGPGELSEASRRLLEETFNEGRLELADQLISPELVDHDPAAPADLRALRGPEVLKRTASMYRAAFPDVRITVDDVITADDKVVLRWHAEGTHRGELAGLAATGAHISVTGIAIDRWKDGKVVESWGQWDNLGLARQLGAAPPEGSIGEKLGTTMQRVMAARMRKKNES